MTRRQSLAYQFPCARADDTQDDRFTARVGPWFTILTVNK